MKKSLALFLAVLMTISVLGGCAKEEKGTPVSGALQQLTVEDYVTVGDYSNLAIEVAPMVEVTQEEVDYYYTALYEDGAKVKDRAVENGDTVVIDFEGKKDGVAFEGGTSEGYPLEIGSGSFIAGFEEGLVGVMPGETVDLDLTFPEDYQSEDLAGAAVVFTVTVNYIMGSADDMRDELVPSMEIPNVSTLAELRTYIEETLAENAKAQYNNNVQSAIIAQLLETSSFNELPEDFLNPYRVGINAQLESIAGQYGMDVEMFASYALGTTSEEYVEEMALNEAQQQVLLQAIANKEGIVMTEEEIQAKMAEEMEKYGIETEEELFGTASKEQYVNFYVCRKVLEFLAEKASITEVEPSVETDVLAPEVQTEASEAEASVEAEASDVAASDEVVESSAAAE